MLGVEVFHRTENRVHDGNLHFLQTLFALLDFANAFEELEKSVEVLIPQIACQNLHPVGFGIEHSISFLDDSFLA